jgi:hypothetical protein
MRRHGGGFHVEAGGHARKWYARLVGYATAKRGAKKQHVVISLKGDIRAMRARSLEERLATPDGQIRNGH